MVLGIVGKKGSGKDTFARFVHNHACTYQIDHFARRLKEVCSQVFSIDMERFQEPHLKEIPFNSPVILDHHLNHLSDILQLQLVRRDMVAKNPRHLLQLIGTEYVRHVQDDYWISYLKAQIDKREAHMRFVLIPDTRFLNEAAMISSLPDGNLLKIVRGSQSSEDLHPSEKEQELIQCPTLYLNEGELFLSEMAASLFACDEVDTFFDFVERSLTRRPLDR